MSSPRRAVFAASLLAALLSPSALALDTGRSILVSADAEEGPARVLLSWNNQANSTSHDVYRKSTATVSWGSAIATLGGAGVLGYTDSTVTPGVLYEYRVVRTGNSGTAYTDEAYVAAGVRVALNDRPGVLALVVDSTFSTSLSTAIAKLQSALAAEGWEVSRVDVSRTATPAAVKAELQSIYTAAGGRLRAAYLFGHVPVPYSGLSAPDGKSDHAGAWPADAWYGDMDGTWSDAQELATAARSQNRNYAGDGKFDQNTIPSPLEFAVGRVDFANMPSLAPQSEQDLLSHYVDKTVDFRTLDLGSPDLGVIWDALGGLDSSAHHDFTAVLGPGNSYTDDFNAHVGGEPILFAAGITTGTYTEAVGIATTSGTVSSEWNAAYTELSGSYFGDWDAGDSFLRAPLAASPSGMSVSWTPSPGWQYHRMEAGATLGDSMLASINNAASGPYVVRDGTAGGTHMALMGDPTMTLRFVELPEAVYAQRSGADAVVYFSTALGTVEGYHVYRSTGLYGPFTRLTVSTVAAGSYTDVAPAASTYTYMVRSVALVDKNRSTYYQASPGAFARINIGNVDITSPTISVLSPVNGSSVADAGLVQVTGSDNLVLSRFVLDFDQGSLVSTFNVASLPVVMPFDSLPPGQHRLDAFAYDAAGNLSSTTITFYGLADDSTAPVVYISTPASGSQVWGTVIVQSSATDQGVIMGYQLLVDSVVVTAGASPNFAWDTRFVSSGVHTIEVQAGDATDNIGFSTITLFVNPALSTPVVLTASTPSLSAEVGRSATLEYVFDRGPTIAAGWTPFVHATNAAGTTFFTDSPTPPSPTTSWSGRTKFASSIKVSSAAPPGTYQVRIGLTNGSTNLLMLAGPSVVGADATRRFTVATITVTADVTSPTLSGLAPSSATLVQGTTALSSSWFDNVFVSSVHFVVDGVFLATGARAGSNFTATWYSTNATNGGHAITIYATDSSGLVSSTQTYVTVSNPFVLLAATPTFTAEKGVSLLVGARFSGGPGPSAQNMNLSFVNLLTGQSELVETYSPSPAFNLWPGTTLQFDRSINFPVDKSTGVFAVYSYSTALFPFLKGGGVTRSTAGVDHFLVATMTVTNGPPLGAGVVPLSSTSVQASWTANGNIPGTTYYVQVSSSAGFFPVSHSTQTTALSFVFSALPVDATAYVRAASFSVFPATWSSWASVGSTRTFPGVPAVSAGPTTLSSVTVNWTTGGNQPGTSYEAQIASTGTFSPMTSSTTDQLSLLFDGLPSASTVFMRVRAIGPGGPGAFSAIVTTWTLPGQPASPSLDFVGFSSAVVSWGSGTNDPAARYVLEGSTNAFASVAASSIVAGSSAALTSLPGNAALDLRVSALVPDGTRSPPATLSTGTAAQTPVAMSTNAVGATTASWNWSAPLNGPTTYHIEASSDAYVTLSTSAVVSSTAGASLLSGLQPNTTYEARVRSEARSGLFSAYTNATPTVTLPAAPGSAPSAPLSSTSIQASWTANGNPADTSYDAQISTDAFATLVASTRVAALQASFTGLDSNRLYALRARSVGRLGALTSFTALPSTATTPATPTDSPTPFAVWEASVTVSWLSGGNAPGTVYLARMSTNAFASVYTTSSTANLFARFGPPAQAALLSNATFWFEVAATSGANTSPFLAIGSTATNPVAPNSAAATATGIASSTWTWNPIANSTWTTYQADLSTDSFATLSRQILVGPFTAYYMALQLDTTYHFRVRAIGQGGTPTAYSIAPATATPAAVPGGFAASLHFSSASLSWTANGNPGTTLYEAESSSAGFPAFVSSRAAAATSVFLGGLTPNTPYLLRARALGHKEATAYTALGPLATLAAVPTAPIALPAGVSSVTVTWGVNGNSTMTVFTAEVSTDSFATVTASSSSVGPTATVVGLAANATHYARVRADGLAGSTAWVAAAATTTPAALPASAAFTSVLTTALTESWSANGNIAGSLYDAELSTDSFATVSRSSRTANVSASFTGLLAATTYYGRVRAIAVSGLPGAYVSVGSTITAALPPVAGPLVAVGTSALTATWTSGGNPGGTFYDAQISTDAFATISASSVTAGLSASFGLGGFGPSLIPDTTYHARVGVSGGGGASIVSLGSTVTLPAPPLAAALVGIGQSTAAVSWGTNGNPTDTAFVLDASTDSFATISVSSTNTGGQAGFAGLIPDTTYYFRVRARGRAGTWSAAAGPVVGVTDPAPPVSPVLSALGVSSVAASWTGPGNPGTTLYELTLSSDGFATITATASSTGFTRSFAGLVPNTTEQLRVRSAGVAGKYTAPVTSAVAFTSAAVPSAPAAVPAGVSSVTLTWGANANPAGTVYRAQLSTDSFATLVASSLTAGVAADFTGLLANATYFSRVRADGWGGPTAFASASSTATPAAAPAGGALVSIGSSAISVSWSANGNAPDTQYEAQASTDAFATVSVATRVYAAQAALSALTPNTVYDLRSRAISRPGIPSAWLVLPSTTTTPLVPGASPVPFAAVEVSSLVVAWTAGGNPGGTFYRAQISTDGFATVSASSDTAALTASFGSGFGTPLPSDTTYAARVSALGAGQPSVPLAVGSTATLPAPPLAAALVGIGQSTAAVSWGVNGNPADTLFVLDASTSSVFAAVQFSSSVAGATAGFASLAADTTWHFRVRAVGRLGAASAYAGPVVAVTDPAPPVSPALAVLGVSSVSASWTAPGNHAATRYRVALSSDSFATVTASTDVAAFSFSFAGLVPNTTEQAQVRTVGVAGKLTAPVLSAVVFTSAAVPVAPAAAPLGLSSVSISWNTPNPAGTVYRAQLSTDAFATVNASSLTAALAADFAGLQANATYWTRVRADGWGGPSAFAAAAATATPAAAPLAGGFASVTTSSAVVAWGANGNAAGTLYDAQLSTDSFATVSASSRTANVSAGFTGLLASTTYYARARTVAVSGLTGAFTALGSTITASLPPAPGPFVSVGTTSLTATWLTGGNPPGTLYDADVSTDNFATLVASSRTANLSVAYGLGGFGSPLRPDTTYQARVGALNGGGPPAVISLGSTVTLPAPPLSPALAGIGLSTASVTWGTNGNPADTAFVLDASTDSFATISVSSTVAAGIAAFSTLTADTTYFFRVRARGRAGAWSAAAGPVVGVTDPAPPAAPALAVLGTSSMTATWTGAGNPAATLYRLELSSDAFATIVATATTTGFSRTFAGLTANTTEQLRVRTQGVSGKLTAPVVSAAAFTAAAAPSAPAAAALGVSSVSLSWGANGNPAGTVYRAQVSTDAFATVNQSSITTGAGAAFAGLLANATQYARVRAEGWGGPSAYAAAVATVTPASAPSGGALVFVGSFSITASWSASGNAPDTQYEAQISTDAFATVSVATRVYAAQASWSPLVPNTNYDLRTRAIARQGAPTAYLVLPSTRTTPLVPGPSPAPFPVVEISSLTLAWTSGGNGPGTLYRAELSTDAFATISASSDTANLFAAWSPAFGTGLPVNTLYAARVRALGTGPASANLAIGSTSTLAIGPPSLFVVSAGSQTATLDWAASGNPEPGTSYELQTGADAAFASSTRLLVSTSGALSQSLAFSTTYWFRVRAVSAAGAATPYSPSVSTATLAPAPSKPGTPAGTTLGVSSISWTWTAAPLALGYNVYGDTSAATLINAQSTAAFVRTGLGPNTPSGLVVEGTNASGAGPRSDPGLRYTHAAPPAAAAVQSWLDQSAVVAWSVNGNPAATTAQLERSTDNVVFAGVLTAAVTYYADPSLFGCTTYWYRVRHVNGDGVATSYSTAAPFLTFGSTPTPAGALTATSQAGSTIRLDWTLSAFEGVTAYRVYWDSGTGTIDYNVAIATVSGAATAHVTGVLASSASYTFGLRAVHRCGIAETNTTLRASAGASPTPPSLRVGLKTPQSGRRIDGNRVTLMSEVEIGTLANLASVRFQYRATGSGPWIDAPAATARPNPSLAAPHFMHWDVTGLAPGFYDLRAMAYAVDGSSDAGAASITIEVDHATPDVSETLVGGRIRRDQTVYRGAVNSIVAGSVGGALTKVVLPAGALAASTATLSLWPDPDLAGAPSQPLDAQALGQYARIDLSDGQSLLSSGLSALLTFSYPDANNDGVVDGIKVSASRLRVQSYDPVAGKWQTDVPTTFDPAARTVTGATPHFSLFGAFAPSGASDLDLSRVYPVPFKPNGPDPDEGRPYSAGDANSGIIFDLLPSAVTIRIYTVDGRLVAELSRAAGAGPMRWDAKTGAGRDAASGIYFAVISSPDARAAVKKLSIIR